MYEKKDKILIVDDSTSNIMVINNILKDEYEIIFATDGKTAIKTALDNLPDLILLDVMMPDIDGYKVLKTLKQDPSTRDIPVIFITALDSIDQEVRGLEAGAVDYITKPIVGPLLKVRVKTHVELKKQRDFFKNLTMIDGLTGIANKRMLIDYLERQYKIAYRRKRFISVLMIDIDYFKLYNDTYGHISGDDCLKMVAKTIQISLKRPTDLAARFGGEEFACILPETDMNDAQIVAERIKTNIDQLKLEHKTSAISSYVTVSIGGTSTVPTDHNSWEKLLKHADDALYNAKQTGRNKIVLL
ncbi:MAG: diguanylate cyclase [Calditerrivibrio sp.]|nr:diguanylate cyclase [Calditerrivibrio sp.]